MLLIVTHQFLREGIAVRRAMAPSASPVQEGLQQAAERQLMRNQLAAAARSINWTYAFFWSISSTQPG
jgi:hypothetical protein